jgi:hypothetical protein
MRELIVLANALLRNNRKMGPKTSLTPKRVRAHGGIAADRPSAIGLRFGFCRSNVSLTGRYDDHPRG